MKIGSCGLAAPRYQRLGGSPLAISGPLDRHAAVIAQCSIALISLNDRGEHGLVTAKDAAQAHVCSRTKVERILFRVEDVLIPWTPLTIRRIIVTAAGEGLTDEQTGREHGGTNSLRPHAGMGARVLASLLNGGQANAVPPRGLYDLSTPLPRSTDRSSCGRCLIVGRDDVLRTGRSRRAVVPRIRSAP